MNKKKLTSPGFIISAVMAVVALLFPYLKGWDISIPSPKLLEIGKDYKLAYLILLCIILLIAVNLLVDNQQLRNKTTLALSVIIIAVNVLMLTALKSSLNYLKSPAFAWFFMLILAGAQGGLAYLKSMKE